MNRMRELDAIREAALEAEGPTDEDRRAVLESIAAHTGLALGVATTLAVEKVATGSLTATGTTGTATLAPAVAVVKGVSLFKGLGLLAGLGVTGALTIQAVQVDEPTSPRKVPSSAITVQSAPAPRAARAVEVAMPPERRDEVPPMAKRPDAVDLGANPARSKQARTLEDEAAALKNIQRALRDGEPEKALALLDAEEGSSQRGILAPERAAARVFALCSSGRVGEARVLARRFLTNHADSPLVDRIRKSCVEGPLAR